MATRKTKRRPRKPPRRGRTARTPRALVETRFAPPAAPRRAPIRLAAAALTDIGRRREHNEDAFHCDASGLFIVADGMGGKAAGEAASRAVVTVLPALLRQSLEPLRKPTARRIKDALAHALDRLSQDLYRRTHEHPGLAGLGSTAAVLMIRDGVGYVGYAGDSRIYLLRGGQLERLTTDQTTAMALVRLGNLAPADAERHPLSHSLEEYIGKEFPLNAGTRYRRLRPGDRWLLCSDGLTRGLPDETLRRILRGTTGAEPTCRALVDAANDADGSDNITALVVDVST
jgi:protein phosphatase